MQQNPTKKSLLQRQIPTILGLSVLLIALVVGIIFVGQGVGVFAPRATPETTPKNVKLTNVTDTSFTVSFLTDEATSGFIKYGTTADSIKSQASDDRDQLSGSVAPYQLHHITVRGLKPKTAYFYMLGTGSRSTFDNNGSAFKVTTADRGGVPSAAKTAYGSVLNEAGGPAEGSLVYVSVEGVGEMSSLVKASGSWAVPLSNARAADGSGYAQFTDDTVLNILVQGPQASLQSKFSITVAGSQPVATVTLGKVPDLVGVTPGVGGGTEGSGTGTAGGTTGQGLTATPAGSESGNLTGGLGGSLGGASASDSGVTRGALSSLLGGTASGSATATTSTEIDLNKGSNQVVATASPVISGTAAPNVTVTITVNSETQIQQQLVADGKGSFTLDLEALKKQLDPGEHTATYTYTDPTTGKEVTKTVTFTVEAPSTTGTSSTTGSGSTATPYGSGNPYSIGGASGSATSTSTKSASSGARSSMPSTNAAIPVSGSVGTTVALVIGGLFFILAGGWSYWLAWELERVHEQV